MSTYIGIFQQTPNLIQPNHLFRLKIVIFFDTTLADFWIAPNGFGWMLQLIKICSVQRYTKMS